MSGTTVEDCEAHISSHLLEVSSWKHTGKIITIHLNKDNDPFQTMGPPPQTLAETMNMNGDAKTSLNQFCQKYCKKPISKTDVLYTTGKVGGGYQSTVKLVCIDNLEFAGEISIDAKTAEKSAAQQALNHHSDVIATLPGSTKNKKRKTPGDEATEAVPQKQFHFATGDGSTSPKAELNVTCAKILRKVIAKTDVVYESSTIDGQGFQATVTMPGLPGEWAQHVWAGECASTKNDAEQSAASIAVNAIKADPTLLAIMSQPSSAQQKKFQKGGFKGGGKGFKGGGKGGGGKMGGKQMTDVIAAMNAMSAMGVPNSFNGGW